jgi:putative transposase
VTKEGFTLFRNVSVSRTGEQIYGPDEGTGIELGPDGLIHIIVYREAGLMLRRKKRKHCARHSAPLRQYTAANQEWALDFAHDAVAAGRAIRVLSVVDAYTRECLALEVDTSFASRRVTRVLDQIIELRGEPRSIRCDNGPELNV